jgi:hypothetical protein
VLAKITRVGDDDNKAAESGPEALAGLILGQ